MLTYTNFFPLQVSYQEKYKQIFEMWEALIPWTKAISFFIAFIHILFNFQLFLDNLSPVIIHSIGHIYIYHLLSFCRLIVVVLMYMVSCY